MADEKLNTGPAENISPEAAEPITTPEQAAASEPQQEQTGPAIPESGDVVVSFDKINELMAEKRQNARAEVEKAETPEAPEAAAPGETPQPANTEEPKKPRRGRPPKAEKAATENQKSEKSAGARKGRPPKADKAAPGEATPEQAHEIGMELAKEILGGKYEFVLTTHIDKDHVHNHLIFNAVSFADHKHYHSNKRSYHDIRRTSDRLCKEHGLSVIIPGQDKGKSYIEHQATQNGTSYKAKLKAAIDRLLPA